MNNKTTKIAALVVVIAVVVFSANSFVTAQGADTTVTVLESQMGEMVSSISRLSGAMEELIGSEEGFSEAQLAAMPAAVGVPLETCYNELKFMTYSLTPRHDDPWDMKFVMPDPGAATTHFIDMNGDGLSDYLFLRVTEEANGDVQRHVSCVYLNTGNGFVKDYSCFYDWHRTATKNEHHYFGDCADYGTP